MKAKKIMAILLGATMVVGLAACGSSTDESGNANTEEASTPATEVEQEEEEPAAVEDIGDVSIDFEDGSYSFVGTDKTVTSAASDLTISVADFNGSKALKVEGTGSGDYVGIQMDALLGDSISSVASVEMSIGSENPDGTFYSTAGCIYGFIGENNDKNYAEWSVYLEEANPKRVSYTVPDGYTCTEGNYLVVSLETDTGYDKGDSPAILYIDDIAFKDASGNVLSADTSAEYAAADTGEDRTNLGGIANAVEFEGFSTSGDGWAQDGFDMPQEIIDALVPGSVVEISYSSDTGNIWLVMPDADAGWMRVGVGDLDSSGSDSSYYNSSRTTAQVTYEQIAAVCGDDVSTWGGRMQCESDGAWEVYSIKVGTLVPNYTLTDAVNFEGFATSGDGWA
ncbi:MAG: hypothetical protein LUI02_04310, partial [Clostridiales bacterium]|nr:hypothetical protein [Clostridiales bacterium]